MNLHHFIHHVFDNPLVITIKTDLATEALAKIDTKLTQIMALLTDLEAQVARNTEVDESAVLLLQGLKTKLDEAGTDPVKLKELSDSLGSSTDKLAAAVAANTPAAVPPAPPTDT